MQGSSIDTCPISKSNLSLYTEKGGQFSTRAPVGGLSTCRLPTTTFRSKSPIGNTFVSAGMTSTPRATPTAQGCSVPTHPAYWPFASPQHPAFHTSA
eukprot:1973552-Rhodomonas_salina.2